LESGIGAAEEETEKEIATQQPGIIAGMLFM